MEYTGSFPKLGRFVPRPNQEMGGRVEDGLGEPDEETDGDDLVRSCCSCQTEREDCPHNFAGGNPDRGSDFGEDNLGR